MKVLSILIPSFLLPATAYGFQTPKSPFVTETTFQYGLHRSHAKKSTSALNFFTFGKEKVEEVVVVEEEDTGPFGWTDFGKSPDSLIAAGAWVALITFVAAFAPGELNSASDMSLIQEFIDNPTAPHVNPIFSTEFNLLALPGVLYACTVLPRLSPKGPPPAPFLAASIFGGYFLLGPLLILRKIPKTFISDPTTELGWATKNIFENKLFNYAIVLYGALCLKQGLPAFDDPVGSWNGFLDLINSSALAATSSLDLVTLTLFLGKEIADDYRVRCSPENVEKANLIGTATVLFPMIGAITYCALRPSFELEEE